MTDNYTERKDQTQKLDVFDGRLFIVKKIFSV